MVAEKKSRGRWLRKGSVGLIDQLTRGQLIFLLPLLLQVGIERLVDPAITRGDIEACVRFLASDELQGRMTGTAECARAGEYLARRLELAGVKPAGDDGGYLQHVPLSTTKFGSVPSLVYADAEGREERGVYGVGVDE